MDNISPPASPAAGMRSSSHHPRPSTTAAATAMPPPAPSSSSFHAKRPSSRITDGVTSRSSDDDNKTAVKVAVRVRPPLKPSDPGYDLIPQRFRDSTCQVPTPTSLSIQSPQGKKLFVFDRVFPEATSQEGVWEYLSDSVASFVKGYNVSILAYGQSGSGKSYTMGTSGPDDQSDPRIMGIVPRAAQLLFDTLTASSLPKTGLQTPKRYSTQVLPTMGSFAKAVNGIGERNWSLKATYVEIYQEQLRDLLVPESVPLQDRAAVAIREDTKGRILVTGLTQLTINSVEDLLAALNFGSAIRQTDATNINARSSRSHAVFSLNLIQKRGDGVPLTPKQEKRYSTPIETLSGAENVITLDSKLHFVDLAGSERLKNTGATGDRAKEGISINAGLASLGKVISQLSSKHGHAHISYRDSKLTRLLQDSLGGNAITFMVACVTPAVFHLSETLNTVHYAQRARAIQSKPEIQQSREEGDKQAAIDRLRAEVSFLRDQIRHSEHADGKGIDARGRLDKQRGREAELETQLMDMQENYNALSNRHAKLIADLSQARDGEDSTLPVNALGDNAMERVKRSNSFAEAVEQMVLEYEKTIQSLESSLSKTRSSLSNSESTLLEKETRIVYMETIQQQLQARMQKAMDREQNNEAYLHDLEMRIQGSTTGEEKSSALVAELRKELARVRESEVSNEEYISTLEERLAEAEQDQEIMQREIDRLEHVVERQRSIGRLDNLLGELDMVRAQEDAPLTNGHGPMVNGHRHTYDSFPTNSRSGSSAAATRDEDFEDAGTEFAETEGVRSRSATQDAMQQSNALAVAHRVARDDFMADKVENLTQELFDLRSEHENVMTDYEKLQQKYQTALETLAKLEYDKETRKLNGTAAAATTFLPDAGVNGEEPGERPSSSRSLSEELSSQPRRTSSCEDLIQKVGDEHHSIENGEEVLADASQISLPDDEEDKESELQILRRLKAENETTISELTANYQSLHDRHEGTIAHVEDLKQELSKAQRASSPQFKQSFFNKRKSTDLLNLHSDPASKSITSLRTIGADNIDQTSEIRQVFDMNLNTVMTELTNRHERMQSLEAELTSVRKDMEAKQTIIAGLTRERGSLKASLGVDFSVVSQMREQLLEGENRIRSLQEQNAVREKEFQDQIESLKTTLANQARPLPTPTEERSLGMPGAFASSPDARNMSEDQALAGASREALEAEHAEKVAKLQSDVSAWETKHQETVSAMQASERKLLATIAGLEDSMRKAQSAKAESLTPDPANTAAVAAVAFEEERASHLEVNEALQRQVEEYKSTANSHLSKLEQLETSYSSILKQVEDDTKSRELNALELETHKGLVANLENQLQVHKSAIAIHQESLESLQASHSRELDDLKTSMTSAEQQSTERYTALEAEHKKAVSDLQSKLITSQNENADLLRNASSALGYWTDPSKLHAQIKGLVEEGKELHSRHLKTTNELKGVQEELQTARNKHVDFEGKIEELSKINEESIRALEKSMEKEKKSSRLVEELEEQLNQNYDTRRDVKSDLQRELESEKRKTQALENQIEVLHRQSAQSNGSGGKDRESLQPIETNGLGRNGSGSSQNTPSGRKTPVNGLPTPPPSIPLPPLPTSPTASTANLPGSIDARASSPPLQRTSPTGPSPPGSRHADPTSPATAQHIEEQETRIRTIEKHLYAEKQLTATLEEALVDLETSANRTKVEMENWRKKCTALEEELTGLKKERSSAGRVSLQAVEEEREMRVRAEKARQALEERMRELNSSKKKKKSGLNCF